MKFKTQIEKHNWSNMQIAGTNSKKIVTHIILYMATRQALKCLSSAIVLFLIQLVEIYYQILSFEINNGE